MACTIFDGIRQNEKAFFHTLLSRLHSPKTLKKRRKFVENHYRNESARSDLLNNVTVPGYAELSNTPKNARSAYTCFTLVDMAINPVRIPHPISREGSQRFGRK